MTTIDRLPISKLKLLENNPRRISKEQMDKLCRSIEEDPDFLFRRPVLVNMTNCEYIVYAGNQRVRAAKKLKLKDIPCIIDVDLDPDVQNKRTIKDNKTYGEFDFDELANSWDPAILVEAGFKIEELVGCVDEFINDDAKEEPSKKQHECPKCGHKF